MHLRGSATALAPLTAKQMRCRAMPDVGDLPDERAMPFSEKRLEKGNIRPDISRSAIEISDHSLFCDLGSCLQPMLPVRRPVASHSLAPSEALRVRDPSEVCCMSEALVTYLNDHLGGAQIAVQLLEAMRDQHDDQDFRQFASVLLPEIEADDRTLRCIVQKVGSAPSAVKRAGGWLLEKAARLKLGHTGSTISRCSNH